MATNTESLSRRTSAPPDRLVPIQQRPRLDPAPRLFAASAVDYYAGHLHGRWIGMARSLGEIAMDLADMLEQSPTAAARGNRAEHWLSLGSEGFGPYVVDETTPLGRVSQLALELRQRQRAFGAWASLGEGDMAHHLRFNQAYLGHFESVHDYVVFGLEAGGYDHALEAAVPATLRAYISIDSRAIARDMAADGDLRVVPATEEGGVYVFDGAQVQSGRTT